MYLNCLKTSFLKAWILCFSIFATGFFPSIGLTQEAAKGKEEPQVILRVLPPETSFVYGQPFQINVSVTPFHLLNQSPTGNVELVIDGKSFEIRPLRNHLASFYVPHLPISTQEGHFIQAVYQGDASYTSASDSVYISITPAESKTEITSSANPARAGQKIDFKAKVIPIEPATAIPDGTVLFQINQHPLAQVSLNASGEAVYSTADLKIGKWNVQAFYQGSTAIQGSEAQFIQEVSKTNSQVTITSSTSTGALPIVQVRVTGNQGLIPTGKMQLKIKGLPALQEASLNEKGEATFRLEKLQPGEYQIQAHYPGNAFFNSANSKIFNQMIPSSHSTLHTEESS